MLDFSFKRGERLKSKKIIDQLFNKGQSFGQYPLRVVWYDVEVPLSDYPIQFTVTVPKRKFPKAVQRNRIKRQLREAYRQRKHLLYESLTEQNNQIALMIIYTGKEAAASPVIEKAMDKIIKRLLKKWPQTNPKASD